MKVLVTLLEHEDVVPVGADGSTKELLFVIILKSSLVKLNVNLNQYLEKKMEKIQVRLQVMNQQRI